MYLRILYTEQAESVSICRCYGYEECLVLPDEINGKRVTTLDSYALAYSEPADYPENLKEIILNEEEKGFFREMPLCGEALQEVVLPKHLQSIGDYAFYYCRNMHTLHVQGDIRHIGGGAFMWCRSLKKIVFQNMSWEKHGINELLSELNQELETEITFADGTHIRLTFPEYYEESVENTPARIISTAWHGSGYKYRQSFPNTRLDMGYYDKLFPYAVANELEATCIHLAVNRLMTPCFLSEGAREKYLDYLREHGGNLVKEAVRQDDLEMIVFLADQELLTRELTDLATQQASMLDRAELGSYLMDYRREHFRTRKKKFEL